VITIAGSGNWLLRCIFMRMVRDILSRQLLTRKEYRFLEFLVGMFSGTYKLRTSSGNAEIRPTHHHAERSYGQSTNTTGVMFDTNPPITRQLEKTLIQDDTLDTIRHRKVDSINAQHETADIQYEREVLKRNKVSENRRVKTDTPNTSSHPQTASILAQHEAANIEYEREILKRNRDVKANKPVSYKLLFDSN